MQGKSATVVAKLKGSDRRQTNGHKLKECESRSDTGKKYFTLRVVRHWHRLQRYFMFDKGLLFSWRLFSSTGNIQLETFSSDKNQNGHKVYQITVSAIIIRMLI